MALVMVGGASTEKKREAHRQGMAVWQWTVEDRAVTKIFAFDCPSWHLFGLCICHLGG